MSRPTMPTPPHVMPSALGAVARAPHQQLLAEETRRAAAASSAGHGDRPEDAHSARSAAFLSRFEHLREQGDEVLRIQRSARELFTTRRPLEFDGFSCLVERLMPQGQDAQYRLARTIGLDLATLQHLCDNRLDVRDVAPQALVVLARAISLDHATFRTLLERDYQRHAVLTLGSAPRSGFDPVDVSAALDAAWERDVADDPQP